MSPKTRFQLNKSSASRLKEVLDDPLVDAALEIAFAEYAWNLPSGENPAKAWDANSRRQGARELIDIFRTLADPARKPAPPISGHLLPQE